MPERPDLEELLQRRAAYSPEEFGLLLGLSRAMIYKKLNDGTIRSVSIGRCRRIPASEVERLLQLDEPRAAS